MAYLLDADCVINALAGKRGADTMLKQLAPAGLSISWITVGELYEGALGGPRPPAHLTSLRRFLRPCRLLGVNRPIMTRFAELRVELRRSGRLIPDFDLLVAATALHYNLTLVTFNRRHFERIPNLKLYP